MKLFNGKILIYIGISHCLLGISPFAFGKQFLTFSKTYFFKISDGLFEFPLLNGIMNYENFASFWFVYFGILIIVIGILINYIEKTNKIVPKKFITTYLIAVLIGVYMIPFSGMTFLMLPHAIYMLYQSRNKKIKV
ncbi:hypothetical protein D1816_11360 [Aquimarina sp. AD10]|uniref:DUF6463 family protein n=1 Tax=Aquimarina sp. AD10 TaxID=1714849 RepID=UPI000E553CBA|nr:DUF6463 family protein [Aquimarina sp. AD10]AXT60920.1 hypothetical protein D1816_11360 [Aquimarina sp. AD10]RKM95562.1 hypothetical protein D7033_16835 [Aquimarina sp. AD10]